MPLLRDRQVLTSQVSGRRYRVLGPRIGKGGFGDAYKACVLDDRDDDTDEIVCLKVSTSSREWHGEAYFGELLAKNARVVQVHDAFPAAVGGGRRTLYVLALDYMPGGTVADRLAAGRVWPEHRVVREIRGLLGLLDELHRGGATHRDVTPQNVFVVGERRLVLGDFGIARHGLGGRPIYADAFAEAFVPRSLRAWSRTRWLPSDDVYQVALLAVSLLCGCEVERAGSRELARLPCSPDLAEALRRALGPRRERYPDAAAMLAALAPSSTGTSEPRSLRGRRVALVGQLPVPKTQAAERVRRAGGHPQSALNGRTDVLVAAPGAASRLRREVSRRRREGQSIAMIRWSDFERLAPPTYRHGR